MKSRAISSLVPAALKASQLGAVADLFAVLSDPTRLRILQMLHDGPANVGEVVERLGIKQANASKHLAVLHAAGVLSREKIGNQARYEIRMPLVFDLCALVCGRLQEEAEARARSLR